MVSSFGATCPRNPAIRFVEDTPRVLAPPARALDGSLARERPETIALVVGGVEVPVEIERRGLPRGGCQAFWLCPRCGALRYDLYIVDGVLACRVCHGLDYRSRHTLHPVLVRAAKLRRKLGAAPGLMSRLPPRPPHWRSDYWDRTVAELAAAENVIAEMLHGTVRALKRRNGRLHGRR
jgi:hypothetical protein